MKVFVLLSRLPWPLEKGDKLRAYQQVKELHKKHEIHLCCLAFKSPTPQQTAEVEQICTRLYVVKLSALLVPVYLFFTLFTAGPLQAGYFFQLAAFRKIRKIISDIKPDRIYAQLLRTAAYVKDLHHIRKTIDYQDAFGAGAERRELRSSWWMKPIVRLEKERLKRYENFIFDYFEQHTIISEQDRQLIAHPGKTKIRIVPNGVDTSKYFPEDVKKEFDLIFPGNMNYPPNVESAVFLVREVMPLVWKEDPGVRVVLCGATPHLRVRDLADSRVIVTGWVDHMRPWYNKSRIMIAPMQMGAGLQNKLLEAMACRIPTISSKLANDALQATPGVETEVAVSPQEYADIIRRLLREPSEQLRIGNAGFEFVKHRYTWEGSVKILESSLLETR